MTLNQSDGKKKKTKTMHKKQQKFQKNKQEERISKFNAKHKKKAFYHWGGNGFAR
jgi:hypothetical protein